MSRIISWKQLKEYGYSNPATPPQFRTHSNYVNFHSILADGVSLACSRNITEKITEASQLKKKMRLIKLTLESIEGEYQTIQSEEAFARLCVVWIPVKSYYLLFNLLLILDYLITGHESSFRLSHTKLLQRVKDYIGAKDLVFNKRVYNFNFKNSLVQSWPVSAGASLSILNFRPAERTRQVLKLLARYQIEDWQLKETIPNFRSKANRQEKTDFITTHDINLIEFFYWYRIKANYRDLEFLDHDIEDFEFADFYNDYYKLTMSFHTCIIDQINALSQIRLGRDIF